jgi:hypothetical protein
MLSENSPQEFSEANGFHLLAEDYVAVNPSFAFKVETFAPTESFKPGKAYRTRIKWRDANGNEQSKLLVIGARDGGRRAFAARRQSGGGFKSLAAPAGAHEAGPSQCRGSARQVIWLRMRGAAAFGGALRRICDYDSRSRRGASRLLPGL